MLNAQTTQFKLADDGHILYQADATSPVQGKPVACLKKGKAALAPSLELLSTAPVGNKDKTATKDFLKSWLQIHISTVLEPLIALTDDKELQGPVKGIAFQVYEAMGIVEREQGAASSAREGGVGLVAEPREVGTDAGGGHKVEEAAWQSDPGPGLIVAQSLPRV